MYSESLIEISNLHVTYGTTPAVAGLDLSIQRGEIFGLLGPNGAGKSSTLGCITGIRRPSTGQVRVAGYNVAQAPRQVKRLLGVQLQQAALFPQLRVAEIITAYAALYDVYPTQTEIVALLTRFDLGDKVTALPSQLSGGQRQRLLLALALVHDPQIMVLDEPTTGLDPHARRDVWDLILGLQTEGRTVLLTTHYMEEAQQLCNRVGIIDAGRLIALGSPAELIQAHITARTAIEHGGPPTLEDVFLTLTGRSLTAAAAGQHAPPHAKSVQLA